MKLDVWNEAVGLLGQMHRMLAAIDKLDFRLRSQLLDSTQSVSSNIAEGYCRRSINEYLQFLNIALGSLGETMTRIIGLKEIGCLGQEEFEAFDKNHFSVENKLIALIKSPQSKRRAGGWEDEFREETEHYSI